MYYHITVKSQLIDQGVSTFFWQINSEPFAIEQRQEHILIEKCPLFQNMLLSLFSYVWFRSYSHLRYIWRYLHLRKSRYPIQVRYRRYQIFKVPSIWLMIKIVLFGQLLGNVPEPDTRIFWGIHIWSKIIKMKMNLTLV